MVKYLSQDWLDLGRIALNSNEDFRKLAKNLNLTIYHIISDVPNKGTVYFWSTFKDGKCLEVQLGEKSEVDFTLTAPYDIWKQIHDGSLEIVQAILEKKLRVEVNPVKGIKIIKFAQ